MHRAWESVNATKTKAQFYRPVFNLLTCYLIPLLEELIKYLKRAQIPFITSAE